MANIFIIEAFIAVPEDIREWLQATGEINDVWKAKVESATQISIEIPDDVLALQFKLTFADRIK